MKFKYILLCLLCTAFIYTMGQNTLSGRVTDASNGQPVPGVVIYIPQLKIGASSDTTGYYKLLSVPKGSYIVEARILGYATGTKQVLINGDTKANFSLEISSASGKEIVVTALGNVTIAQRSPTPVTLISHEMYIEAPATNVVDAIATQPGITAITTGPGVSKPEVRGLGFNRVLTALDGVRQQDFQWGDEHGIQIDPNAVYDVEIIRGPASLQYGSDAVGGVVNFKSAPFPESGVVQGSVLTNIKLTMAL